jgi:hypothetical protein
VDRDGDRVVLVDLLEQLALDRDDVGVVERRDVRLPALQQAAQQVVVVEEVDLVGGAALLARPTRSR